MVDELFLSPIRNAIRKEFPEEQNNGYAVELASIWAEVLENIVRSSNDQFFRDASQLHINIMPELLVSLINTIGGLAETIVSTRTAGKTLAEIDVNVERDYHASARGMSVIEKSIATMTLAWRERYEERWEPKSIKILASEHKAVIPKPRRQNAVKRNHFISAFFLKKHWAEGHKLSILRRDEVSGWKIRKSSVERWGSEESLYSERLEYWFSLIEGDAEEPIRKLLSLYPLNAPENLAFLGYLIVQKMRNPTYRRHIIDGTLPVSIKTVGKEKARDPIFQRDAYEAIFRNNQIYDQISRPLLWSKWVIVRTKAPVIILPDTFCIMSAIADRRVLIAPLTPTACFVATGIKESEKSILPREIRDEAIAISLSNCLLASTKNEAVCNSGFPKHSGSMSLRECLNLAIAEIDEHLSGRE